MSDLTPESEKFLERLHERMHDEECDCVATFIRAPLAAIEAAAAARATAPLLAERDALRAALEDIADRYVSDNNIRPAGFATWAGERALAALTPQAPAASGERCGYRFTSGEVCESEPEHPRHFHRPGDACEDEDGTCSRDFAYCHPFHPAEPEGGAA